MTHHATNAVNIEYRLISIYIYNILKLYLYIYIYVCIYYIHKHMNITNLMCQLLADEEVCVLFGGPFVALGCLLGG